jgi:hypothetical protein
MSEKKIILYYMGRRLFDGDRLYHAFEYTDDAGNVDVRYWKRIKFAAIGYPYEASLLNGERFTIAQMPQQLDGERHKDTKAWEAAELVDVRLDRRRKLQTKLAKSRDLDDLVERMAPFVANLTWSQKRDFVEELVSRIKMADIRKMKF